MHRFDHPACRRERQACLGSCGGNASSISQDFITFATKAELSERVLGTQVIARARANCSVKTHTFEIELFPGAFGEQFILYASRLRVRGGFTGTSMHFEPFNSWLHTLTSVCPLPVRSHRPARVRGAP